MKNVGDYVVYKKDVCKIVDIKENSLNHQLYYTLVPVNDDSLKIDVPESNPIGNMRDLITKKDIDNLIKVIPSITIIETNNKLIETEYRDLLKEGSLESLIKIIKTTYLRNKERLDNNKKKGDKDDYYFNLAERYLYTEIATFLNISFDEARKYIIDEVSKIAS